MASRRPKASRLQSELARRILTWLKDENAQAGQHLVELDLCQTFGVSRTPIRGALKLLAVEGVLSPRAGRGYVLTKLPTMLKEDQEPEEEEDQRLFDALARARGTVKLAESFTQQEIVRRFHARLATVLNVLRKLKELGLIERKPGHGWAFAADSARCLNESYAFRRALEPQILLQPGFKLNRHWAERARGQHQKWRKKAWRPGDGTAFHALNADFHEQLARCSGNHIMLKAIQNQNQLRHFLIGHWDYPMEQVHSAIDDHLEILAALESGYADKAAALMLHHLTQSASHSQKEDAGAPPP
jgi:DNA-binding GntR family transcriptional regulator